MNKNQNLNWHPSSIDDITTQCESLSLCSSETDNITLDSGIFFENKGDSKNQNSPVDGRSIYHMLNSPPAPPPPPYNSTHNIISRILDTSEVHQSFQTTNAVNTIPYNNESICSNIYSTSTTKPNSVSAYLIENSTSRTGIISSNNTNSLSHKFHNEINMPNITDNVIYHSRNNENDRVIDVSEPKFLPKIPDRQKTECTHYNVDTNIDRNISRYPLSSHIAHHILEQNFGNKTHTFETTDDRKSLGICNKCQYTVTDSESACIALGKFYHSVCFVCSYCNRSLRGKVFYKVQDNVYCEHDYMVFGFQKSTKTCIACGHIITESILEALGKSFHPQCFKCSVCDKCLDGIPFTVDKNNNIYCIPDYHLTFAPRCAICCQSITPCNDSDDVVRVVVNERDFHVECYRCQNCFRPLTNDSNCFVWTTNRSSASVKLLCRQCYGDKFRELSRCQHH